MTQPPSDLEPVSEAPADLVPVDSGAIPAANPTPANPAGHEWLKLYSGLDGLDSQISGNVARLMGNLDRVTDNPKEARAKAVNQAYVSAHMPGVPVNGNWQTVKDAYAQKELGMTEKNISDTTLYGAIGKRVNWAQKLSDAKTPYEKLRVITESLASHVGEAGRTEGQKADQETPFVKLPEVSKEDAPDIPSMGMANPALVAGVYNSVIKPVIEGAETKEGMGLLPLAEFRVARGIFAAVMAKSAAERSPEMMKILQDPKAGLQQKVEAVGSVVTPAAMGALSGLSTFLEASPKAFAKVKDMEPSEAVVALTEESAKAKTPEEKAIIHAAIEQLAKVSEPAEVPPPHVPEKPLAVPDADVKTEVQPLAATAEATTVKPEGSLAGIKNAVVDEEMAKMGLDPAEHGAGLTWEQAKADADAKIAADPFAGQKLVKSLSDSPRPITGQEDALLLTEVNRLKLERDGAEAQLIEAKKSGNREAEAEANVRIAAARDAFTEASETATKIGTPQAQGLALRRMMMREDYSISSMERQLAAETKDGKLTPDQVEKIRDLSKTIRETAADLEKHMAQRLKAFKTRTAKATEELQARVKEGRLAPKEKPAPLELDPEAELLKAAHERAKQEFDRAVLEERIKNRSFFENSQNTLVKWRRGFLLSNPVTLAKLTAAAAWRMGTTVAEEGIGTVASKIPGVKKVAEKAPRYGAANSDAEAAAITQAFTTGMKDAWDLLKTGKSNLDVIYGHGQDPAVREYDIVPRSAIDLFGSIHGALKSPVKRGEFARSFQKRVSFAIRNGVDASNPMVQTKIALEAYKDANRSIFLQDNLLSDFFKRGLSAFEQIDKTTGQTKYPAGKMAASAFRVAVPIVKVPTNIVAETFEYATGSLTGSWRLGKALKAGVKDLHPAQADLIMRNLQKGSLGAAAMLLGWFNAENVGGYYQPGEKRKPGDVKAGSVKVFGVEIPSYLLHLPVMETVQIGVATRRWN